MKHVPPPAWLTERPIAHRGLHKKGTERVENTIPAIIAAMDAGYAIEVDVQLTKDLGVAVIHDRVLGRMTGIKGHLADMTLDEVTKIEITGSNSTIMSLQELLDLIKGKVPLFIELKVTRKDDPNALPAAMIDILRAYKGPLAVMSYQPLAIKYFKDYAPTIPRGLVIKAPLNPFMPRFGLFPKHSCKIAQPIFVAHDIKSIPNSFTRYWKKNGGILLAWVVKNNKDQLRAAKYADQVIFEIPAVVGE